MLRDKMKVLCKCALKPDFSHLWTEQFLALLSKHSVRHQRSGFLANEQQHRWRQLLILFPIRRTCQRCSPEIEQVIGFALNGGRWTRYSKRIGKKKNENTHDKHRMHKPLEKGKRITTLLFPIPKPRLVLSHKHVYTRAHTSLTQISDSLHQSLHFINHCTSSIIALHQSLHSYTKNYIV